MTPRVRSAMLAAKAVRKRTRGRSAMSRALVLGGGGPVGIAWECGVIAGLARNGVDLGGADLILGTSAGSFVGARLAMGDAAAGLAEPILAEAARLAAAPKSDAASASPPDLSF